MCGGPNFGEKTEGKKDGKRRDRPTILYSLSRETNEIRKQALHLEIGGTIPSSFLADG